MTKQEILDYFSLIDFAYNESGRLESLSRMLDELMKEQEHKDKMFHALEEDWKRLKELLKEQNKQIAMMKMIYGDQGNIVGELVRCKDCKHWDKECTEECDNIDSICFHNGRCKPDWFCADGERK